MAAKLIHFVPEPKKQAHKIEEYKCWKTCTMLPISQESSTLKRAQCVFAGPTLIQIPSANLGNHFCVISSPLFFIFFVLDSTSGQWDHGSAETCFRHFHLSTIRILKDLQMMCSPSDSCVSFCSVCALSSFFFCSHAQCRCWCFY